MNSTKTESTSDTKDVRLGILVIIAVLAAGIFLGIKVATKSESPKNDEIVFTRVGLNDFLEQSGFERIDWSAYPTVKDEIIFTREEFDNVVAKLNNHMQRNLSTAEVDLIGSLGTEAQEAYEIELARSLARKHARD